MSNKAFFQALRQLCTEHNILLVLDEVQCGLSRTGKFWAFEHYDIKPDAIIVGKALGGGVYPVSCVCAKKELMDVFIPGDHGSTFAANPIACAVASSALAQLSDKKLIKSVQEKGEFLYSFLRSRLAFAVAHGVVKDIRALGLFAAIEFSKDINAKDIANRCLEKGVLVKDTHSHTLRIAPAFVISKKLLKKALKIITNEINAHT